MFVTEETFQSPIGWLKGDSKHIAHVSNRRDIPVPDRLVESGLLNILPMLVTEETFQSPIGWLKGDSRNILLMLVTEEMSQSLMDCSKAEASLNISAM